MKFNKSILCLISFIGILLLLFGCNKKNDNYSRGVGVYPGNPSEDFSPVFKTDNDNYRNLARNRTAYHSSSYDYNLTAQLITDGIIATAQPAFIRVTTSSGDLPKNQREYLFDQKSDSRFSVEGNDIFLQVDFENMPVPVDKFELRGSVEMDLTKAKGYEFTAYVSNDGETWEEAGQMKGTGTFGVDPQASMRRIRVPMPPPSKENTPSVIFKYDFKSGTLPPAAPRRFGLRGGSRALVFEVPLKDAHAYKHYKIALKMPAATKWSFSDLNFYKGKKFQVMLPGAHFTSAWKADTAGEEWVYVDLGDQATYDKVMLNWINKAVKGVIQSSDDAKKWTTVSHLPGSTNLTDAIELNKPVKSRYVRLLLSESADKKPYILSEMQVMGKGGLVAQGQAAPAETSNKMMLTAGNWRLQRASEINGTGEVISKPEFVTDSWIPATVPGSVLASYINIGAVSDPNFADNQLQISDSYFISDFWYRNEFTVNHPGEFVFLNFDGVNWKAEIYMNGAYVGNIDGAFMRGKFDVTKHIRKGKNVLAVKIFKNDHPGAIKEQTAWSSDQNGGIPGADNPTFHASIGWDWIPTIRGRNIGIWNDVYLTYTGAVTLDDPFVRTELPLPDTTSTNIFVETTLKNHSAQPVKGLLKGTYGDIAFEQTVELAANEEKLVTLDASNTPALHFENPILWWPVGYGAPHLYDVNLNFTVDGEVSDETHFKSGVRQLTYDENVYIPNGGMSFGQREPRRLSIYINGRRFIGFGGNWGFSESNLNYRGREYDIAVAYHADMHFTMIRNWVGQIGDEEFYEACDRHGVMVWQDFWLANPVDGPNPYYPEMFNANAKDYIKRIRNHPSIGIYVGRNEGNPPAEIDNYLREVIPQEHPGLHYISNSASGVVSGGGPYRALEPMEYFRLNGHDKFHSERGMPNVMNYESMVQAFGIENIEPVNTPETPNHIYGLHDYTLGGGVGASAQAAASFNDRIAKAFGKPKNAKEFADRAQWINYEGYRAIFEGRSEHRRGMLLWMSHPAWPSMVWQTYDYYFDPNGGYFGSKKASEPLHIQWNPLRNDIEVVNYHAFNRKGLTAIAQILNQDGKVQWSKDLTFDIDEDQTVACFPLEFSDTLTPTCFIKLTLTENGKTVSDNFYLRGKETGNYQSLGELPAVKLTENTSMKKADGRWYMTTTLKNDTGTPALLIRLNVVGSQSGQRILPVFYSNNYLFLMPGDEKEINIRLYDTDARGETPQVVVSGFNL